MGEGGSAVAFSEGALKSHKAEQKCKADLGEVTDQAMAGARFESRGLEAKVVGNEALGDKYWVCESLAKLQDEFPHQIWEKYPNIDDMRNTLVVELSQILGVPVKDLQGKLIAELVQLVQELF